MYTAETKRTYGNNKTISKPNVLPVQWFISDGQENSKGTQLFSQVPWHCFYLITLLFEAPLLYDFPNAHSFALKFS